MNSKYEEMNEISSEKEKIAYDAEEILKTDKNVKVFNFSIHEILELYDPQLRDKKQLLTQLEQAQNKMSCYFSIPDVE